MVDFFLSWDHRLLYLINGTWTAPWLDAVMAFVSDPKPFLPFLGAGALALLIWGGGRGRLFVFLMLMALIIGDAGINWAIKRGVNRPRPNDALENIRIVKREGVTLSQPRPVERGRSFTSGHACNNVALAFMATMVFGRLAWPLWPWAAVVSYSRIYCGAHYPSDILGSWVVALLYAWGLWLAWQKWGAPRWEKSLSSRPS